MYCNFGVFFPIYQPRIMNVLQFQCVFPYLLVSNSRIVNRVKFSTEISIYAQYYRHSFILGFFNYLLMASMVTSIHLVKPLDFLSNNVFSKVVSMYKNRVNIARSIFLQKIKEQEFQQFYTLFWYILPIPYFQLVMQQVFFIVGNSKV